MTVRCNEPSGKTETYIDAYAMTILRMLSGGEKRMGATDEEVSQGRTIWVENA